MHTAIFDCNVGKTTSFPLLYRKEGYVCSLAIYFAYRSQVRKKFERGSARGSREVQERFERGSREVRERFERISRDVQQTFQRGAREVQERLQRTSKERERESEKDKLRGLF